MGVVVLVYIAGRGLVHNYVRAVSAPGPTRNYALQAYKDIYGNECNVAVVRLENDEMYATDVAQAGYSSGYGADALVAQIEQAKEDKRIKGLLLEVDSPGGSPVAGEMVSKALKALGKPSVALIYDMGDSAAYFAATGADTIIASPFSSVGDIGVTGSFVDYSGSNEKEGNKFVQISSGKYKDAGNPDKPLTPEEKALLQSHVDEEYDTLIAQIAKNRHMPLDTVRTLADGAALPGSQALEKGLIDMLGNLTTARDWLTKKIGRDATLCDPDQTQE